MGYELKMRVGWLGSPSRELKHETKLVLDEDKTRAWFPAVKKGKDEFVYTGRTERYFIESAKLDLCKIYDSETYKLAMLAKIKNPAKCKTVYVWSGDYEKNESEDCYGEGFRPVSLAAAIKALEADVKVLDFAGGTEPYHRFVWALDLLKAMHKRPGGFKHVVLFYGH